MKAKRQTEAVLNSVTMLDGFGGHVSAITELSYGQEVHRRIGTAAGLAIVSFGIGALVAFSKSKKHYIGIVWDAGDGKKGGVAFQADKNEYRGLIAALEGVSGKKAVDTDAVTEAAAKTGLSQVVRAPTVPTPVAQTASTQAETPRPVAASIPIASQQAEPVRVISAVQPGALKTVTGPAPINPVDVTFASNPPGAMVFFNGTAFTRTPFVTKLMPGTYTVQMQLAGFPDWSSEITIEAAKPSTFVAQLNSTTGVVLK
jgi:PEGA domain